MSPITRDIDPAEARDLLRRVPRAALSVAGADGPLATPVTVCWREPDIFVGLPAALLPDAGTEAVLLIDEGVHFFDLRALYLRGTLQPAPPPADAPAAAAWFTLDVSKSVAWDYGTLREAPDAGG